MPFISLLDDRAKPKGSRDPLGFESVWSHFGRKVVGNLTTITSSMDNFAVALLGFYWVNKIIPMADNSSRHKKVREAFLRYEQLTGYVRYYGKASDIMGITRIKKRVDDDKVKLTLGLSSAQQILSDQASYGLWGLYSTAARETGLVEGADRKVTKAGQAIVNAMVRRLGKDGDALFSLALSDKTIKRDKLEKIAKSFIRAIHHKSVQEPLLNALMSGKDKPQQVELWKITQVIFQSENEPENVEEFVAHILKNNPSEALAQSIYDIVDVEKLLVASNNIFHYCRGKNGDSVKSITAVLDQSYSYLPAALPKDEFLNRLQLSSILDAFKANDVSRVIRELLKLNKDVMKFRNGAPWLELAPGNVLEVKVKNEKARLKSQADLENKWDYDYFLGSYLNIAKKHIRQVM